MNQATSIAIYGATYKHSEMNFYFKRLDGREKERQRKSDRERERKSAQIAISKIGEFGRKDKHRENRTERAQTNSCSIECNHFVFVIQFGK